MKFLVLSFLQIYSSICFSVTCASLLAENGGYTYLDKGQTGVVYVKEGLAFKIPYNPDALDSYLRDGYEVVSHEFQLLATLNSIITKSKIKGIRPLRFNKASKLEDPILLQLAQDRVETVLETETWVDRINLNGVLVSEHVIGRNYYNDIINSPLVSDAEKRRYATRFHEILLALEKYILSDQSDFNFIMREKVEDSDFDDEYDYYNFIETLRPNFENIPNSIDLKLLNPFGDDGVLKAFTISVHASRNVIVDENDDFVIIDPH